MVQPFHARVSYRSWIGGSYDTHYTFTYQVLQAAGTGRGKKSWVGMYELIS